MIEKKLFLLFVTLFVSTVSADDLLPDLVTSKFFLTIAKIDKTTIPGRVLLRFSNSTKNLGDGSLELRGGAVVGDRQLVNQRIYNSDKSYREEYVGTFINHPTHKHVHLEDYAQYRIRKMSDSGGVGDIVVEGEKTSYCIRDNLIVNPFKKHFSLKKKYKACDGGIQGISVGWTDVYLFNLPEQWVDITNQPVGDYWLESEVNPNHNIIEKNYGNNITRINFCLKEKSRISFEKCSESERF